MHLSGFIQDKGLLTLIDERSNQVIFSERILVEQEGWVVYNLEKIIYNSIPLSETDTILGFFLFDKLSERAHARILFPTNIPVTPNPDWAVFNL